MATGIKAPQLLLAVPELALVPELLLAVVPDLLLLVPFFGLLLLV